MYKPQPKSCISVATNTISTEVAVVSKIDLIALKITDTVSSRCTPNRLAAQAKPNMAGISR